MNKLFFIFLIMFSFSMKGQYLKQSQLINYKSEIIDFLTKNNGVSGSETEDELLNMIYILPLLENKECISIYQLGTTSSHSIKYVLILKNSKLQPLMTNDIDANYIASIKAELCKCRIKKRKVSKTMRDIKEIIDYNSSVIKHKPID